MTKSVRDAINLINRSMVERKNELDEAHRLLVEKEMKPFHVAIQSLADQCQHSYREWEHPHNGDVHRECEWCGRSG